MLEANAWGEAIPEPLAAFSHRVISPRNIEIEERRRASKVLPKRQVKRLAKRRDKLDETLKRTGFRRALLELQDQAALYRHYSEALDGEPTAEERARLEAGQMAARAEGLRLRSEYSSQIEIYREYKAICARLDDHAYALQREREIANLQEQLAKEASYFEQVIVETLARLGYKHEWRDKRGKRQVDKVRIARRDITGDQIWYKIETTRKTMGRGFKSVLPQGVRARDLVSDETCFELSTACQRQVTSVANNNGAWLILNRLNTIDGIKTYVTYEQLMRSYRASDRQYLPIPMGVGLRDEISWLHLAQYPHILIAGTTGGGKSNMINVIVATLISQHTPAEVQFTLIDLKEGLEFQHYEKIPHLMRPPVLTVEDAATVMLQLEQLRAQRGKLLAEARVKHLDEYNEVMERRGQPKMPRVIVIFDEFAAIDQPFAQDLKKSILASAIQLTNKARAAGIHLILCTQRPSVDVVPGHIKDNMAFRIAGVMPTQAASTTILGVGDAANLPLIKGRMVAMAGSLKWQLQTPYITKADIDTAVRKATKIKAEMAEGEGEKVLLPEAKGSIGFGPDDLLHLVMDDYQGQMNLSELWQQLKDTGLVSHGELHKLGKALKAEREFEYEGQRYRWVRLPGGKVTAKPLSDAEPAGTTV